MTLVKCRGFIFDLDGVITRTAHLHALAWENMFNEFLKKVADREKTPFKPFDPRDDYQKYVDGKPRFEGILSFLNSRYIKLPYGTPQDTPDMETIHGLGNKKNKGFQKLLHQKGPEVIDSTVRFIKSLKNKGIHVGVASSSRNCELVLQLAKIGHLFETRVDGVIAEELNLKGKPEPDIFVAAARNMGLWPGECVVVEDAISGVQAGRNGNFGLTLGIARNTDGELLQQFGADIVVHDLSEIGVEDIERWFAQAIEEDGWRLTYHGFDPGDEKLRETLCTVGNGYLGTRGCFEGEDASFSSYPGTYIAGIYNKVPTRIHGKELYNNDLVNCPNWLPIEIKIGDGEFRSPLSMKVLSYTQILNMREAVLERTIICKDKLGRITRICAKRFASMANPRLCAIRYEITPFNYSLPITIRSSLDGNVENRGVPRYHQLNPKHLSFVASGTLNHIPANGIFLHVRTTHSKHHIVMTAKTSFKKNGRPLVLERRVLQDRARISEEVEIPAIENSTYTVDKLVSVATSLDGETADPRKETAEILAKSSSFGSVYRPHVTAWKTLWKKADVRIHGDRFTQQTLRLHIYHLLVTASPHIRNLDVGLPARGLHGEAYRGHIFWDELFILPFFLLHFPPIARSSLLYRYNRLNAARDYAEQNGYRGAMFPWQTADDGSEETQELHYNPDSKTWGPDLSRRQRHVSIAIFYNIWRYVSITGDVGFLRNYGAEIMIEIARFWVSIAVLDETTKRYHIRGVMGPDEFHEKLPGSKEPGLTDNGYTNVMVVWLLEKALALVQELPKKRILELKSKIGFTITETEKWRDLIRCMNVVFDENGIINQFAGYMDLEEFDWNGYRKRYYSLHRLDRILKAEKDSPDKYKVSKQADALMLFYVLPPKEVCRILAQLGYGVGDAPSLLKKNYEYYEPRTTHGSTLSKIVHATISSNLHVDARPWNWFMEALRSDVFDTQGGTTTEGIHAGAMAGTIDIIVRSFARLDMDAEIPEINPRLPEHWFALAFKVCRKGIWYDFLITRETVEIGMEGKATDKTLFKVLGKEVTLSSEKRMKILRGMSPQVNQRCEEGSRGHSTIRSL